MQKRLKAEWEKQSAILLAFPHENSDWKPYINEARVCYLEIIQTIARFQKVIICLDCKDTQGLDFLIQHCNATASPSKSELDSGFYLTPRILLVHIDTNDTWARDFGAISLECTDDTNNKQILLCDFIFNGWGEKFDARLDNAITQKLYQKHILKGKLESFDFILEGGSIDTNGAGVLLTNTQCLLEPNRNPRFSQQDIEHFLESSLGIHHILWLHFGFLRGDDTDSHIDTLARFIAKDTIAYIACEDSSDEHFAELQKMESELQSLKDSNNTPYKLIKLPFTKPIYYDNERLPASYANFLFINGALLVPTYNDANDKLALEILAKACPDYEVIGIDCSVLIRQHGSLHCISMQLYES